MHFDHLLCSATLLHFITMEYITSNKGGRKLAFENNIYIKQKVLSNGAVWGDIMGGFCPVGFCLGGFCPGGDFVQEDFVQGDFVLEPLPQCVTLKIDKLQSICYQPSHLWKGQKAIKKLKVLSKEKSKVIKQWLSRQAFWQVPSPSPKHVDRPHYEVTIPNEVHQFDLLRMLSDMLYRNKYKYILL